MFTAVMPDGSRLPLEAWVVREWERHRNTEAVAPGSSTFFDPELGRELEKAVEIYPRHAR